MFCVNYLIVLLFKLLDFLSLKKCMLTEILSPLIKLYNSDVSNFWLSCINMTEHESIAEILGGSVTIPT